MLLSAINRISVPQGVVSGTMQVLRRYGTRGYEGMVLWVGTTSQDRATVIDAWVPPQQSLRDENGVGYFVPGEALVEISSELRSRGVGLIAQVHSHPGRAYHSPADDQYAIVTTNGGFSLVVPNFGRGSDRIADWAVYRLKGSRWRPLSLAEISATFQVDGAKNPAPTPGSTSFVV
jgi:hypothetical protein